MRLRYTSESDVSFSEAQELSQCCFVLYSLPRVTVLFISSTLLHHIGLNPVFYFNFLYYHADIAFFRPRMFNILSYKTKDCLITCSPELRESHVNIISSQYYHSILLGVRMTLKSLCPPLLHVKLFVQHISCWQCFKIFLLESWN